MTDPAPPVRKSSGMTLLELLVAVAITLVVGASIAGALYSGRSAWQSGDSIIRRHQNVRAALEFISRDLTQSVVFSDGAEYQADFWSDGSSLLFSALSGRANEGFEVFWVAYRLNGSVLERAQVYYDPVSPVHSFADIDDEDFEPVAWDFDAGGLSFGFRYFDGAAWHDESSWDYWGDPSPDKRKRLPDRANITISIMGQESASCVRLPLSAIRPYLQP